MCPLFLSNSIPTSNPPRTAVPLVRFFGFCPGGSLGYDDDTSSDEEGGEEGEGGEGGVGGTGANGGGVASWVTSRYRLTTPLTSGYVPNVGTTTTTTMTTTPPAREPDEQMESPSPFGLPENGGVASLELPFVGGAAGGRGAAFGGRHRRLFAVLAIIFLGFGVVGLGGGFGGCGGGGVGRELTEGGQEEIVVLEGREEVDDSEVNEDGLTGASKFFDAIKGKMGDDDEDDDEDDGGGGDGVSLPLTSTIGSVFVDAPSVSSKFFDAIKGKITREDEDDDDDDDGDDDDDDDDDDDFASVSVGVGFGAVGAVPLGARVVSRFARSVGAEVLQVFTKERVREALVGVVFF